MGDPDTRFGDVRCFLHLHTQDVLSWERSDVTGHHRGVVTKYKYYRVHLGAKPRPMVVLWSRRVGTGRHPEARCYLLLPMTSKYSSPCPDMLVRVANDSYVDCREVYTYHEELICLRSPHDPTRVENRPLRQVYDRLPPHLQEAIDQHYHAGKTNSGTQALPAPGSAPNRTCQEQGPRASLATDEDAGRQEAPKSAEGSE